MDDEESDRETKRRDPSKRNPKKQLKGEDCNLKKLKTTLNKSYKPVKPKVFFCAAHFFLYSVLRSSGLLRVLIKGCKYFSKRGTKFRKERTKLFLLHLLFQLKYHLFLPLLMLQTMKVFLRMAVLLLQNVPSFSPLVVSTLAPFSLLMTMKILF
jgi:hypothetical protein